LKGGLFENLEAVTAKTPELFRNAYITELVYNSMSCTPDVMVIPPRLSYVKLGSGVFFTDICSGLVIRTSPDVTEYQ
jgi:hypothetical protein